MRSSSCLLFFLALVLSLQSAVAIAPAALRRQGANPSIQTPVPSTKENVSSQASATVTLSDESPRPKTDSDHPTPTSDVSIKLSTSTTSQASATNATSRQQPTSSTIVNSGSPLPIQPTLTPALGVSGILLMLTGLAYAIIGIKNKWIYVFGSAAYLTTLSVTVLIVYLMSPPVSNAIQGAFFVAAFFTGVIFGVLSLVFSDITEGFGCLLGGFCLSMWFLSLKDGGLIPSATGRAIFIGCVSAGGYAFSFSHYTRNYGLMVSIALSGATATILGIDCFARAGLKEFWLYLWNLNDNIFPLNTNTYPVTKNIKAELAGIVIVAILSLVTQLRVSKLVQDRRAKSAAQQLEKKQDRDREEEALGRKVEHKFQRERAQWEAAYGGKSANDSSFRSSVVSPKGSSSIPETDAYGNDSLEMVNLAKGGVTKSINTETPTGTTVTVGVLDDDEIHRIDAQGHPIVSKPPELARGSETSDKALPFTPGRGLSNATQPVLVRKTSLRPSGPPPPPAVIPLPFAMPKEDGENDELEDHTSVSAEPEINHEVDAAHRPLSKRISDVAALRKRISHNNCESQEALCKASYEENDQASSVAATLDDDHDNISLGQLSSQSHVFDNKTTEQNMPSTTDVKDFAPLHSHVEKSLTTSTDPKFDDMPKQRSSLLGAPVQIDTRGSGNLENNEGRILDPDAPVTNLEPQTGRAESHVGSLQDGLLPQRLSKVAVSYRTNEWAKHLETAEKPKLDELSIPFSSDGILDKESREMPVVVSDEIASPIIGKQRNSKRMPAQTRPSTHSGLPFDRSGSTFSRESLLDQRTLTRSPPVLSRAVSSRSNSATRLHAPSPLPSNTLLSQRESIIKNRVSSQSLTPNSSSVNLLADEGEQENMTLSQRRQLLQNQSSSPTMQHQTSTKSHRKAPPSASQKWQKKGWTAKGAPAGFDSHQPKRTSSSQSDQKREELYAEWRENMQDITPPQATAFMVEQQREALISERRQKELEKQQREMMQQQRASQMESMMRSGQMLDAHREAMRRMQANASKNV